MWGYENNLSIILFSPLRPVLLVFIIIIIIIILLLREYDITAINVYNKAYCYSGNTR